jgi:cation diffusion facilitator CzcD-associated flavoprotein CzcO
MKNEVLDAIVIGAGFAGLCAAIKLKENNMSFLVLEKENSVGGVWKVNTYPGAQCDVQSHLYSFSFEQNPNWTRTYGLQPEIQNYLKNCSQKYGIDPYILFQTEVVETSWLEEEKVWKTRVKNGNTFISRIIFFGIGGLSQVVYPDIKGIDSFQGKLFHSARWDHSVDLKGKKVAIIGSAASAIQIIPQIAPVVDKLFVMQRSASWIIPKNDRSYSDLEKISFQLFPPLLWASRELTYWMLEWRAMAFVYLPILLEQFQNIVEKHIRNSVKDPILARKVTPDYKIGCKRILLSNDYYDAIQRPNVDVVTTGISEIDSNGLILKDGSHIDADIIITATGFKTSEDVVPFPVIGRNGVLLDEQWKLGPEAYMGTTIKNFPNLFMIVGPNTGLGHSSMVYMIEAQVEYSIKAIRYMKKESIASIEVKSNVQDSYNQKVQEKLSKSIWNTGGCVSWYRTKSGKNTTLWPGFTFEFKMMLNQFHPQDYNCQKFKEFVKK